MYRLDASAVVSWVDAEGWGRDRPDSFDTVCPNCSRQANFWVENAHNDDVTSTTSGLARCAACRTYVHIWVRGRELYMQPAPIARQPISGADSMPTAIRQAYQDTIDVFNAGVWSATATQTRRTLEGIVQELLPEQERTGPLAQQLRKLAESESVNLAQPLITLSHALRESGNIGAHFDLTRTTDRATAEAMLDLIDYLIEYIYALPEMIEELNRRVQQLDQEQDEQPET